MNNMQGGVCRRGPHIAELSSEDARAASRSDGEVASRRAAAATEGHRRAPDGPRGMARSTPAAPRDGCRRHPCQRDACAAHRAQRAPLGDRGLQSRRRTLGARVRRVPAPRASQRHRHASRPRDSR